MGIDNFLNLIEDVKEMDEGELMTLVQAIRDRKDVLSYGKLKEFKIGDMVSWVAGKGTSREDYEGEVYKINPKTIAVKVKGKPWCKWRISPSMLTKIEGDES